MVNRLPREVRKFKLVCDFLLGLQPFLILLAITFGVLRNTQKGRTDNALSHISLSGFVLYLGCIRI
jgi:hypothetical protein